MTSWTRIDLGLAVVVALLAMWLAWPTGEVARAPTLTALAAQAVSSIRIEHADRLEMAFSRDADAWAMTYPHAAAADPRRVGQLLAIAAAPVLQQLDAADEPGRYGLDRPSAVVQFDAVRIEFGDRDPSQQARYVRVDQDIAAIDELYFNLAMLPATHFRAATATP
ncbi:MAG: DUF4340 domain-containing protein [Chromatiaceae bacterium]|nr:DUF4340 domain-containing protein [Chromatiaceae bacterium]MCP5422173.1 DUF4340 domain-containing protein [Chromatiaceae bacterium]